MARSIDRKDAKRLVTAHRALLAELIAAEKNHQSLRAEVKGTSDILAMQEARKLLKDVPVEELNRELKE